MVGEYRCRCRRICGAPAHAGMRDAGRSMSESLQVDAAEMAKFDEVDEVWVPTEWHADAFSRAGLARGKIWVLPEAVDTECARPPARFMPSSRARRLGAGQLLTHEQQPL